MASEIARLWEGAVVAGDYPRVAQGQSIYDFIRSRLDASGRLEDTGVELPDESKVMASGGLRWVAGGMDGAMGHHMGDRAADQKATQAARLFADAAGRATKRRLKKLYAAVSEDGALDYVDPMIERLIELHPDVARVRDVGRWLATTAPDRGAVKIGLAILGVTGLQDDDLEVVRRLGAHEEFTLYVAVAIRNGLQKPDRELWSLAKAVDGWGRIHCVERLSGTTDSDIRSWILRSGYRNSVMYEYLAYIAATTGELLPALRAPNVDRELLTAAGEILAALVAGGPAEDLDDYDQGAEAVEAFMGHMDSRAETLDDFHAVAAIESFLTKEDGWEARSERGWDESRRRHLLAQCTDVLKRGLWNDRIAEGLRSEDPATFWQANQAARKRGIDTFELHFQKVADDPLGGPWFEAWSQADEARGRRLAELARRAIPLEEIASGLGDELGLGREFRAHQALDWTLQALRDFPGLGGDLVIVGLRSPVTRNRNMALNALKMWPAETWPSDAQSLINHLASSDPNEQTRGLAREVANDKFA